MLNVALTGNVAAGKTTVARLFREWGATLIDSDVIVHQLQQPGTAVFDAIVQAFGNEVVADDGTLRRDDLRRLIMTRPEDRHRLNSIVHPAVLAERQRLENEARAREDAVLVSDIPLLFEAADPDAFDVVVLVDAPDETRRARLVELRGLDPAEAADLMAAQAPVAAKRDRSDHIIMNDGTKAQLEAATRRVWTALQTQAG